MTNDPRGAVRALAFLCLLCACLAARAAIPIQHWVQPSGAKIYFAASPSIPIVDVRVDFDAGGRREPGDMAGLANITADMTAKGIAAHGSEPELDENQLGEAWADLGAGLEESATSDRMSFSLRTLAYPDILPKAVALAARQLGQPSFPDEVWQRERQRLAASVREANTRPGVVAGKAYAASVYGKHPYGHEVTEESLARINVADMKRHYQMLEPCRAKVSIVGALTREQADGLATALLSRLPAAVSGKCDALPAVPDVPPLEASSLKSIPFASAQAHVLMGQPGYKRNDPDHFPLIVGNYILGGGGLVSRLAIEVREKRGLSYSAGSSFSPGLSAGAFTVSLQTRPDQAQQALQVARDVVSRFIASGPTPVELKAAKDYLVGGYPLLIDSNRKLLDNIANIAWYDLPLDYLDTWTAQVQRVTAADVKSAFGRKLHPDRMVTVTVGAPAAPAAPAGAAR
ncbi:pitrilysin family protein [Ramlibacter solisilvae]|uniref:Zinc protease n=1 Tax=Ramlibacter tataouinensis TaxID=94132 RepID=A0A127JS00_9BURK|nr:pitrilysin family protein [Ramlibacter tataouinensis]AMO22774.1 zinc protease [Ramlibacter tataouinensis]